MENLTLFEKQLGCYKDDIGLYKCGFRKKAPNHEYGPEIRSNFIIVVVEEGNATLFSSGNATIKSGDLLVLFPGERIHYKASGDWSICWLGVFSDNLEAQLKQIGITRERPILKNCNSIKLKNIIYDIYDVCECSTLASKYHCQSLLCSFMAELFNKNSTSQIYDSIEYALEIIKYNYNTSISVESISKILSVDPSHFSREFKKKTGISPKKYISDFRLEKASELLMTTSYPIGEIAYSVGVFDPLYFCRIFKSKYGLSPGKYRLMQNRKN